jgi:hypothetical protein
MTSEGDRREPATARGGTTVPAHVLEAIYGKKSTGASASASASATAGDGGADDAREKKERYDESLKSWWRTYSERKNDEEEEHVADSLLYDYRHLPRTTPAPNYREDRLHKVEPDKGTGDETK